MWQTLEVKVRARSLASETPETRHPGRRGRWIFPGLVLGALLAGSPLQAQGRGEVQVTARVLPMVPSRDAAIAAAMTTDPRQTSQLFRVTRVRGHEPGRTADPKREELIVVVEFLAN
jgi:hypothetical protein